MTILLALLSGSLIGSIPFAVLFARRAGRFDTRREGTRHPLSRRPRGTIPIGAGLAMPVAQALLTPPVC